MAGAKATVHGAVSIVNAIANQRAAKGRHAWNLVKSGGSS